MLIAYLKKKKKENVNSLAKINKMFLMEEETVIQPIF